MSIEELLRINVTTASKKSESLFDAPAIMLVLTESDIQSYGGRSLVEVLDRTTSVFFMGTQENLQGALTMRGDATLGANNHILVLVNGRPIQESTYGGMIHPFLRSFPLASVKQVEIIRGPGSVLYGTNAYVGVINVITKAWDGGIAGVSYGSFDTKTISAAGGTTTGHLQVSAGMAFSHDDGWDFTATDSLDNGKGRHHSNRPLVRPQGGGEPQRHVQGPQPGCVLREDPDSPHDQLVRNEQLDEIRTSVTEGPTGTRSASFTATLSAASSQPITVSYSTANGSAWREATTSPHLGP